MSQELPSGLQARLDAAGVTDAASLQAALDADPQLRADLAAFAEANQNAFVEAHMQQFLVAFAQVADREGLASFWQQVPLELEDAFLQFVEQQIAEAEQNGNSELVEGLQERRDGLRQLRAEQQQAFALIDQQLAALDTATEADLSTLWNAIPLELEDVFLHAADDRADAAGRDPSLAERLRANIAALRQLQDAQRAS